MEDLTKAFGLPESIDPTHVYVFRTGEYGVYDYMYKDNFGNYYKYTNAPKEDPDYDKFAGDAILIEDQPSMTESPEYFDQQTQQRLTIAIPQDAGEITKNEAYDPADPALIWHSSYISAVGDSRFVYVETDVIENFDLWYAHVARLTDVMITPYRRYSSTMFQSKNIKDRIFAVILMLADQGMFEPAELVKLTVGDVEFIDTTVKIYGRKFVPDPELLEFFSSVSTGRKNEDHLFVLKTAYGEKPIGVRHIYSMLKFLKVNSHSLISWHLSQSYTRIMARLLGDKMEFEDAEAKCFAELSGVLSSIDDVSTYVSGVVRTTVEGNYRLASDTAEMPEDDQAPEETNEEPMAKAITASMSDDFGALPLFSGLAFKAPDEIEFSRWLHSVPLHDSVIAGRDMTLDEASVLGEGEPKDDAEGAEGGEEAGGGAEGAAAPAGAAQAPDTEQGTGGSGA